ncbi:hypothetical protein P4233_31190 [Pseudomonas aeruginosa]|nr:hypothetical protein [Pseudomonas aeruginosa]
MGDFKPQAIRLAALLALAPDDFAQVRVVDLRIVAALVDEVPGTGVARGDQAITRGCWQCRRYG